MSLPKCPGPSKAAILKQGFGEAFLLLPARAIELGFFCVVAFPPKKMDHNAHGAYGPDCEEYQFAEINQSASRMFDLKNKNKDIEDLENCNVLGPLGCRP